MELNGKKVVVTGGAGAIGSRLVRALLATGARTIVLDNLTSGSRDLLPKDNGLTLVEGSVADKADVARAFAGGADAVYHLAAQFANQKSVEHPEQDLLTNGLGTLHVLEASRQAGVGLFVFASSSCVYGNMADEADEATGRIALDTPYAMTKFLGEQYTDFFHRHHGLPTVIFRIFNSYGPGEMPGMYRNVIPNFLQLALDRKPLPITGNGEETRTFNFVTNLVDAFIAVAGAPAAIGERFNVGEPEETSIAELAEVINRVAANPAGVQYLGRRDWDHVRRRRPNIAKAQRVFNYRPENNLERGIRETLEWLRTQRSSD